MPSICIISDTHAQHHQIKIPVSDLVLFAGDYSHQNNEEDLLNFLTWLRKQHEGPVVMIAGNHDKFLWKSPRVFYQLLQQFKFTYLENSLVEMMGIKIWGSPVTPPVLSGLHRRFEKPADERLQLWNNIPEGIDIVMTHCPPYGILDEAEGENLGCKLLLKRILDIKPKYHVFGHIHQGYGNYERAGVRFINASSMSATNHQLNPPVSIKI